MSKDLPKGKPIISVDFDGVLHSYTSGWKGARTIPDDPVPFALEWLVKMVDEGKYQIAIYSSRSNYLFGRWAIKCWLREHYRLLAPDYEHTPAFFKRWVSYWSFADPWEDEVNWAISKLLRRIQFPLRKPPAFLQIDDRAIQFKGIFPQAEEISSFKPWYK